MPVCEAGILHVVQNKRIAWEEIAHVVFYAFMNADMSRLGVIAGRTIFARP